jgi:hypothetical protein
MIALREVGRRGILGIVDGMLRLFVPSVGRILLFRLSQFRESRFYVGNVSRNEFRLTE